MLRQFSSKAIKLKHAPQAASTIRAMAKLFDRWMEPTAI